MKKKMDICEFETYCRDRKPEKVAFIPENQLERYMLPNVKVRAVYPEILVFPKHNMVCIRGSLPDNDISAGNMLCFDEIRAISVDEEESLCGTIVRLYCGCSPVPQMQMVFMLVLTPAS